MKPQFSPPPEPVVERLVRIHGPEEIERGDMIFEPIAVTPTQTKYNAYKVITATRGGAKCMKIGPNGKPEAERTIPYNRLRREEKLPAGPTTSSNETQFQNPPRLVVVETKPPPRPSAPPPKPASQPLTHQPLAAVSTMSANAKPNTVEPVAATAASDDPLAEMRAWMEKGQRMISAMEQQRKAVTDQMTEVRTELQGVEKLHRSIIEELEKKLIAAKQNFEDERSLYNGRIKQLEKDLALIDDSRDRTRRMMNQAAK